MTAAKRGDLDVVRYLVTDKAVWTPLIWASAYGHLDVVRYLLEQGANRDKASNDGTTSLHYAANGGYLETP